MAVLSLLRTSTGTLLRSMTKSSHRFMLPCISSSVDSQSRSFDIYKFASKEAIQKERERITDEMNRGYFADISELKKHGGKMAMANKTVVPSMVAKKFPSLEVERSDGSTLKIPIVYASGSECPKASLLCLSFRASSQPMIESWCAPFLGAFNASKDIRLHEVSFVDSWLLSLSPVKRMLLRVMRKSSTGEGNQALKREIVYFFGDHYYFRKELQILNLLTGYIFLLDRFGKIRWQGFGLATKEEVSSLLSCTYQLLEEK
ncbi:uncharacterized protein LOC116265299 [Nymphaea colorata]|nr:uncharacterized protein LOC116265299 [Nymphaea colorata]